jgi:CRP-like cAMP-binding protein
LIKLRPEKSDANRMRDFAMLCLAKCGALSAEEAEAVHMGLADMHSLRAGTEIIAEGMRLDNPQLLLEGWVVRQRILRDGRRQILSFVLPGDILGLCGRPDGVALFSTVALTAVTVAPMPAMMDAQHERHTALGRLAHNLLTQEEAFLCNQIVRLGSQSAHERLISLLLEFHTRLSQVQMTLDRSFTLPLTQEVLSDALGLSVVHTNRTLQQLKREHLVASGGSSISLSDLTALSVLSDYWPSASRC